MMIKLDMIACSAAIGGLLAVVIKYWLMRLAIRGGIEDATRRERSRAAEQLWIRQKAAQEVGTSPQERPFVTAEFS